MTMTKTAFLAFAGAIALAGFVPGVLAGAAEAVRRVPAPAEQGDHATSGLETAVVAGGCFWGVQGVFQHVKGVTSAVSGYAGGTAHSTQYKQVSTGGTRHAEAVEITFDPAEISYGEILQIYFSVAHDPTELDRQGPDVGTQYRSAIFPVDAGQKRVAKAYVAQLQAAKAYDRPIVTTIESGVFFAAEAYHQNFLASNPDYPYIVVNDLPKIEDLHRLFPERFREEPMLVPEAASAG